MIHLYLSMIRMYSPRAGLAKGRGLDGASRRAPSTRIAPANQYLGSRSPGPSRGSPPGTANPRIRFSPPNRRIKPAIGSSSRNHGLVTGLGLSADGGVGMSMIT